MRCVDIRMVERLRNVQGLLVMDEELVPEERSYWKFDWDRRHPEDLYVEEKLWQAIPTEVDKYARDCDMLPCSAADVERVTGWDMPRIIDQLRLERAPLPDELERLMQNSINGHSSRPNDSKTAS